MREPQVHSLKTHPDPFRAVRERLKYFEFRRDDRGFEVMDGLMLKEWDPFTGAFTGQEEFRMITYIARGPAYGIPEGFCVLSITELNLDAINDTSRPLRAIE